MEPYIGSTNSRRMFGWKKTKRKQHRIPIDKYGSVNSLYSSYGSSYSLYGTTSIRAYPWENCMDLQEPIYEDVMVGEDNCTCDSPIYAELYSPKKKRVDEKKSQKKFLKSLENRDPFSSVASRKSILECDVTAYDLVKKYFKSKDPHLDSDLDDNLSDNAVEDERTAVTSPPSSTISEGESGIYSSIRLAGYGIRVGASSDGTSSTQCSIASDDGIYSLPEPDYDDSDEDIHRFKDLNISSSPLMVKKHNTEKLLCSDEASVFGKKYLGSSAKMAASVKVYPTPNRTNLNKISPKQNNTMTVAVRIRNAPKSLSEVKSILKKTENNGHEEYVNKLNLPIIQEYKDMRKKKHVHFKSSSRESLQCIENLEQNDTLPETTGSLEATRNDNIFLLQNERNGFETVEDFLQKSNSSSNFQSKCKISFSEFSDLRNRVILPQPAVELSSSKNNQFFTQQNTIKDNVPNTCFKNQTSICSVSASSSCALEQLKSQGNKNCVNDTKEKNHCSTDNHHNTSCKISNSLISVIKSTSVPVNVPSQLPRERSVVCIQNTNNYTSSKNGNLSPAIRIDVRGISLESQISRTEITSDSNQEAKMVNCVKVNGSRIDEGKKKDQNFDSVTLLNISKIVSCDITQQNDSSKKPQQDIHLKKVDNILIVQNEPRSLLVSAESDNFRTPENSETATEIDISHHNTNSVDSSVHQVGDICLPPEKPLNEEVVASVDISDLSNVIDKIESQELSSSDQHLAEEQCQNALTNIDSFINKAVESRDEHLCLTDVAREEQLTEESENQLASTKNDVNIKVSESNLPESFHHKSFFEGASKTEILNYLEDAKSRGLDYLNEEDTLTMEIASPALITAQNCTSSIAKFPEEILQDISRIPNLAKNLTSNMLRTPIVDSAEILQTSDLTDDIECLSSNADVERNDSGVGMETSKPSRLRRLISPGTEELLCADCDLQIELLMGKQCDPHFYPLLCKKCSNKRSERKETIAEIVDTEFKYGRDLKVIKEEFYCPMEVAGLLTKVQLKSVFINLDELIRVNGKFAEKLKDALDIAVEQGDEDYTTVNIGRLFLESSSMLHAFETYCVRQASASMLLANLEKEKELLRIFLRVSQMENTLLRRMNLPAFLMVPVQRVTKYPLLLSRLHKVTPYQHQDRESLKEAQQKIELHLEHINQQTKGSGCAKIWRRFSNISVAAHRRIANGLDIGNIKLRKMALEILRWNREEVRFVMAGKLHYAQASEYPCMKKSRKVKYTVVHALLATLGKPNASYRPDLASESAVLFPKNTGIRDATLLLMKEKNGRFVPIREPLHLGTCVISSGSPNDDVFEVQEYSTRESFLFKAEAHSDTKEWLKQLRYHAKDLGAWRRRRNALANIMINGMMRS